MLSQRAIYRIARSALPAMRDAWHEWELDNGSANPAMGVYPADECELYLYVYGSGEWIIDHAQYLQDHRDIIAAVSLGEYRTIRALAQAIEDSGE